MNKISTIIIIILVIFSIACEKQEPVQKNQYMFHCLLIEGDAPKIKVWKTLPTFPKYAFDVLYFEQEGLGYSNETKNSNFLMNIKCNNETYDNFETKIIEVKNTNNYSLNPPNGNYEINYLTNNEIEAKPGDNFEVQVDILEMDYYTNTQTIIETLKAKTIIPKKINIDVAQQPDLIKKRDDYIDTALVYEVSFDDPVGSNYYYMLVYSIDVGSASLESIDLDSLWLNHAVNYEYEQNPNQTRITVISENSQIMSEAIGNQSDFSLNSRGVLFNDERFNGSKKKIILSVPTYYTNSSQYLFIDLLHVNENYYNYYYALYKQNEWKEENLYAEPVQLYTNIENGLGVFAGASLSRQILKIESKPQ